MAPPQSFIHVGDYSTVQELAQHLLFLSNNSTEYSKYLGSTSQQQHHRVLQVPRQTHPSNNNIEYSKYLNRHITATATQSTQQVPRQSHISNNNTESNKYLGRHISATTTQSIPRTQVVEPQQQQCQSITSTQVVTSQQHNTEYSKYLGRQVSATGKQSITSTQVDTSQQQQHRV